MEIDNSKKKICVIGAGSFGTALSFLSGQNGHETYLYSRSDEKVNQINTTHINQQVCKNTLLPKEIIASSNLNDCLQNSEFVILSIPVQQIREFLVSNKEIILKYKTPLVSSSKGMCVQSKKFISELVNQIFENQIKFGVISGPSFAEEILKSDPTLVVMASSCKELSNKVQKMLSNSFFRIYTQEDVLGVEISAALKNVIAIGSGIVQGSGYGYNTKTALISRSTREMLKFMELYGAKGDALFGLAGIGDLMLTCFGKLSRNMTFGLKLAEGIKKEDIIKESKGVVEGLPTLKVVVEYCRERKVYLPIIETIYQIVEGKIDIKEAGNILMTAELVQEYDQEQYHNKPLYKVSL